MTQFQWGYLGLPYLDESGLAMLMVNGFGFVFLWNGHEAFRFG